MRIALLSASAEHPDFPRERLAFRRFVGKTVLAHQIELAVALDCEQIICFASGVSQDMIACQKLAERAGARFSLIESNRQLAGLVTAADQLIILADGLLCDNTVALDHLGKQTAILAFPAEDAVPLGHERIDQNTAWAGVMHVHGSLAEKLNQLPEDSDPISSLLRIALQTGAKTMLMDDTLLKEGLWSLNEAPEVRTSREKAWFARLVTPAPYHAPGLAIAERVGLRLARDLMGGALERLPWLIAVASGIGAAGAVALERPLVGLGCALAMTTATAIGNVFERLSSGGKPSSAKWRIGTVIRLAGDVLIAGLLSATITAPIGWLKLFIPLVLLALLWMGERRGASPWRISYADRIILLSVLYPAAIMGFTLEAACALIAIVIAALYLVPNGTRDELDVEEPSKRLTAD